MLKSASAVLLNAEAGPKKAKTQAHQLRAPSKVVWSTSAWMARRSAMVIARFGWVT